MCSVDTTLRGPCVEPELLKKNCFLASDLQTLAKQTLFVTQKNHLGGGGGQCVSLTGGDFSRAPDIFPQSMVLWVPMDMTEEGAQLSTGHRTTG